MGLGVCGHGVREDGREGSGVRVLCCMRRLWCGYRGCMCRSGLCYLYVW